MYFISIYFIDGFLKYLWYFLGSIFLCILTPVSFNLFFLPPIYNNINSTWNSLLTIHFILSSADFYLIHPGSLVLRGCSHMSDGSEQTESWDIHTQISISWGWKLLQETISPLPLSAYLVLDWQLKARLAHNELVRMRICQDLTRLH